METITLVMILATIGVFLARFVVKQKSADLLCGVMSVCTMALTIRDSSIATEELAIYLMPTLTVLFMTFIHIMFGSKKGAY